MWMSALARTPGFAAERTSDPATRVVRITSDEAARAFAANFCEDLSVQDLTINGPDMLDADPAHMGDDGLRAIGRLVGEHRGLRSFRLAGQALGLEVAVDIARSASSNGYLTSITFWNDRIDDTTACEMVALLLRAPNLQRINLGQNLLTQAGRSRVEQLVAAAKPQTKLQMF
eukprot:m51a1_g4111 hypothetical protein (173) ;mRNA; r:128687-129346